jgi:uncharacterized protein (TIGR02594 family)
MITLEITAFEVAQRYIGLKEITGPKHHPFIQWCFSLCSFSLETPDEVPWCSACAQHPAWELRLPRSKSAAARSWLQVGRSIPLDEAECGFDVVILKRGGENEPGPDVIDAKGHVGWFSAVEGNTVLVLGGNQSNAVSLERFPISRILGVRRLKEAA